MSNSNPFLQPKPNGDATSPFTGSPSNDLNTSNEASTPSESRINNPADNTSPTIKVGRHAAPSTNDPITPYTVAEENVSGVIIPDSGGEGRIEETVTSEAIIKPYEPVINETRHPQHKAPEAPINDVVNKMSGPTTSAGHGSPSRPDYNSEYFANRTVTEHYGDSNNTVNNEKPIDYAQPTGPAPAPYGLQTEPQIVQEEVRASEITGEAPLGLPLYDAGFGDSVKRFFKNYTAFSGRASRAEFWWATLFLIITPIAVSVLSSLSLSLLGGFVGGAIVWVLFIGLFVFEIGSIIPGYALLTRRAHDSNKSGWWIVIMLVLGIASGVIVSVATGQLMSAAGGFTMIDGNVSLSAVSGNIPSSFMSLMGLSGLLNLAVFIMFLMIGLSKPKPGGVRFDKQTITPDPEYDSDPISDVDYLDK